MKNSVPFVSVICFMACILRVLCDSEEKTIIVMVMAFINAFAFLFVLYLLIFNTIKKAIEEISGYTIDNSKKKRISMTVQIVSNLFILVVFGLFGGIYMKIYNELFNDILAIVALGISIISDDMVNSLYKIIVNISKKGV